MRTRILIHDLANKHTVQADSMCRFLELRDCDEGERFGRYYLAPPGESRFASYTWVEVVVLRHGLIVHGDCDTVVFKGFYRKDAGPRAALYWLGTNNYTYAEEKASCRLGRSRERDWDPELCRAQILDACRDEYLDHADARALLGAAGDYSTQHEFLETYHSLGLNSEDADLGEVTPWPIFSAQAVLRRLLFLLRAQDFRKQTRGWFKQEKAA